MWKYHLLRRSSSSRCFSTSSNKALRWWNHVFPAPKDPISGVTEAFLADTCPRKINLGVGAYRDDEGKPVVLQCVREAEAKISGCNFLESVFSKVSSKLVEESVKLVYGKDSEAVKEGSYAGIQAISGTGACRLFAEFQRRFYPGSQIYFPDPTWSNHHNIWRDAQVPRRNFHYYDWNAKGLNFSALIDDIKNAPDGSFFLLHPCAHNPTGVDPTEKQWREISYWFKVKNHFPFFDTAYQGFASGDLDRDAQSIRIFLEDGHWIGCAQSFSKNMGLYGHRVGCLSWDLSVNFGFKCIYEYSCAEVKTILCADTEKAAAIKSQLEKIARAMYGSPPVHGILLVSSILGDPNIKGLWEKEVKVMVDRIQRMRATLIESLTKLGSSHDWEHIKDQVGMFCYSGLTPEQVNHLRAEFSIYMTRDGRMSMAGVTTGNVSYLANALHEVTKA